MTNSIKKPGSKASPAPAPSHPAPNAGHTWQPRFGLGAMMLVMLVCGVMSSAGYYLVRGNMARPNDSAAGTHSPQLAFLLITLASPLLLAVIISAALQISRYLGRRSSR